MNLEVNEIAKILSDINNPNLIYDFLISILTEKELEELGKRWALVKLLDSGMSQRAISSELGLSLCKITRGSKELKKKDSSLKKIIDISRR